ncbi:MAG: ABC transporter permease [Chloroflexi bacterium]|nr:ABC transporter permease [Chloroflexota bacterium]
MDEKPMQAVPDEPPADESTPVALRQVFVRHGFLQTLLVPVLAVLTALLIGAVVIAIFDTDVIAAWRAFLHAPWAAVSVTWATIRDAYTALFVGSVGSPRQMIEAFRTWQTSGETRALLEAFRPFSESLVISTPYMLAGLAVALGFRGGVFNIGAEGQLFVGGLATAFVGYSISNLPWYLHLPLALLAGFAAGALWGAIPGLLKAYTGAHEVINTIMMNYIAFRLTDFLLQGGPMTRSDGLPITPEVLPTSYLPALFPRPMRLHAGFFLALALAFVVYWFLWRTTIGLEIRMAGANPHAARYAGVRITRTIVMTMALSGALAGLSGANQVLGLDHRMVRAFSSGYGFDSIALALLGSSHPLGVVLASLLFGFLRGGAARMQSVASVPVELIKIIQGMVIIFIAAPAIIRSLYRLKESGGTASVLVQGWGQ